MVIWLILRDGLISFSLYKYPDQSIYCRVTSDITSRNTPFPDFDHDETSRVAQKMGYTSTKSGQEHLEDDQEGCILAIAYMKPPDSSL